MSIKDAMKMYFEKLEKRYLTDLKSLPTISYDEKYNPCLFIGEVDEDDEIQWKAKEQEYVINFTEVENSLGIELHNDLKEYFNSYWFYSMRGIYENIPISLNPITPDGRIEDVFLIHKQRVEKYNGDIKEFILGIAEDDNSAVVFNNTKATVDLINYMENKRRILSNSIENLIRNLEI